MIKKKIRFPLEMKNGVDVRTLEELQNHFALGKVLLYAENGKLDRWLRDRYINEIADRLTELNKNDSSYCKKICELFDVKYETSYEEELRKSKERNRKLEIIASFTDEKRFADAVDFTAFEQEELYDLLERGVTTIYLCGDRFEIPDKCGIKYIGVNSPKVFISPEVEVDFEGKNIKFEDVVCEINNIGSIKDGKTVDLSGDAPFGEFVQSDIHFMLSPEEKKASRHLYEKLSEALEGVNYDIDRDICELRDTLESMGIAGMAKVFLGDL